MSPACSTLALLISVALVCTTTLAQNSPQDYVDAHNSARAAVGVGPVTWDDTVAAYAQNYANQRIGDCKLMHSDGPYGENLFQGYGADYTATDAVNAWVSEQQYYDYNSNSCTDGQQCGHYTQVVWWSSTAIGCARVVCNNGCIYIICNYNPPGNYVGQRPYPALPEVQPPPPPVVVLTNWGWIEARVVIESSL